MNKNKFQQQKKTKLKVRLIKRGKQKVELHAAQQKGEKRLTDLFTKNKVGT